MRRSLHFASGLVLAGVFLWLTLRHVDGASLGAAMRQLSPAWMVAAPVMLALGYGCRVLRWRMMLRPHNPELGFGRCGVALVASIAVNNLLPLRAGDVLRCFGFSGWLKVSPGPVLATVLVERLLDLSTLVLALALALWWFALDGAALGLARSGSVILGTIGATAFLLLWRPQLLIPLFAGVMRLAAGIGSATSAKAEAIISPLLATLISLSGRRAMPSLMGWSALVWLFEGATYWTVARAMTALPLPGASWLVMPVGTLSTLLPSTPGHVGTFDYFAQTAAMAVGNPLAEATAFILIVHVALWLPTTVTGGICLVVWAIASRSGPGVRR